MGETKARGIIVGAGAGAALLAAELAVSGFINDGPSRTAMDALREREAAKTIRETWEGPPETRQQRRARERRAAKRNSSALARKEP